MHCLPEPLGDICPRVSDSAGAQTIMDAIGKRWPWVKHLFADGAHDRTQPMDKAAFLDFIVEVVPRRRVVERTVAWFTRWRLLVRDYEKRVDVSEAKIHIAMGNLLLRRISQ